MEQEVNDVREVGDGGGAGVVGAFVGGAAGTSMRLGSIWREHTGHQVVSKAISIMIGCGMSVLCMGSWLVYKSSGRG